VLVYITPTGNTTGYYELPYTEAGANIGVGYFSVGQVNITTSQKETGIDFRFVIIAGTSLTGLQLTHPGVNLNDYNSVKSALHLSN
jgi:hypothetical protein